MTLFINVHPEEIEKLVKKGYHKEGPKSLYEQFRLVKKDLILILYTSRKLLLQGQIEAVKKTAEDLQTLGIGELVKPARFRQEKGWIIGSDESLKGDTFGGMVVAAVKADEALRQKLIEMGVADSKTLSAEEVMVLARKIKSLVPCEILSLLPEEYNSRHGTITLLLNKLHQQAAQELLPGKHIVD